MKQEVSELSKKIDQLTEVALGIKKDQNNSNSCPEIRRNWIPKSEVMQFLGFAETQMASIIRSYPFIITTIGKKKFFHISSIEKVFKENQNIPSRLNNSSIFDKKMEG